jgi:hypothetical protein
LRALQKRVVEGLVTAATERAAATGRGFQDTGSTAKAFEGEEVDWYVCNVASYHIKQAMDVTLVLVKNEDLKRWLLAVDDETVARAAAVAVGMAGLESLLAHFIAVEAWVEGAKVERAMSMVSAGSVDRVEHAQAALGLLEQAGSTATRVQQLELDIRGSLAFTMRTGPAKKHNAGRMQALMATNESLRVDPLGLYYTSVSPRLFALCGQHPAYWDAGKVATQDTIRDGLRLNIFEGMPLKEKAVEESVGARKECIRITVELCTSIFYLSLRSTDETAEMHQQLLEAKWGKDGSVLTAGCMDYRFDRHFMITQGIGSRQDSVLCQAHARGVAEYCGDVQQMVQLFEKQLDGLRKFIKRGVPGMELPNYFIQAVNSFTSLELNALHPFGNEIAGLLETCEGQCTDPSECEGWYGSADWGAFTARLGEGRSSKDGLHHMCLKPGIISDLQAVVSLCLASTGTSSFDLTWLDNLPAADDSKLHNCTMTAWSMLNTRVLIAEVLEWQGRHKEAIR